MGPDRGFPPFDAGPRDVGFDTTHVVDVGNPDRGFPMIAFDAGSVDAVSPIDSGDAAVDGNADEVG
jgi:hypothetical protein